MSQKSKISNLSSLRHNALPSQIKSLNMRHRRTRVWARLVWSYTEYLLTKYLLSEFLQAYEGLGNMCLVGLPLPHSGIECRTGSLEQSNSVLQQCRPTRGLAYRYVYWQSRQIRP